MKATLLFAAGMLMASMVPAGSFAVPAPTNLATESASNPAAVATNTPLLTWTFNGATTEKGFQVLVASSLNFLNSDSGDRWNTGHVWQWDSGGVHPKSRIVYTGKSLAPGATYYWKVRIWDRGNYWVNGGDSVSPWSAYASFTASSALMSDKEELKKVVFNSFLDTLYANTLWSIVSRLRKSGYNKESGPENLYNGEFGRSVGGAAIAAYLATRDYTTAGRSFRFFLQACKNAGVTRAPHTVDSAGVVEMNDQPDGNYHVVNYWSKYLAETGDTAMENDFYELIKTFANNSLNTNYYSLNYGLIYNPNLEHSRHGVYEKTYDLITNIFAVEALRSMIPVAQRRGDAASVSQWTTYCNSLLNGIAGTKGTLKAVADGLDTYREELLFGTTTGQTSTQPASGTVPVQNIQGMSWVNLSVPAIGQQNSPVIDTSRLYNTLTVYERQGNFMWDNFHVPLTHCTPGWSNCTIEPNRAQYAVIGKGLGWEMEINRERGQWNRISHLCRFVSAHTSTPLYPESFWFPDRHSDFGNLEQVSWWIWAMARIRDDLCALFSDDFERDSVGSAPDGWTAGSGSWQVYQDAFTSRMVRCPGGVSSAILCAGQNEWTDYSVTANVKVASHSATGGSFGVGGRYAATGKFYAFMFSGGKLGLYKNDGSSSELASVNLLPANNRLYVMKIKFEGTTIKGFLDNELVLSATDAAIASGKAVLVAGNDDARFDRILVKTNEGIELESERSWAFNRPAIAQSGSSIQSPIDWSASATTFWDAGPYPQWWRVDLEDTFDINKIAVKNYVDGTRYYHYTIESSIDGVTWTQVAAKSNNTISLNAGDSYSLQTTCRYLRVNMAFNSANTGVHIKDFRAFGRHHLQGSVVSSLERSIPAKKSFSSRYLQTRNGALIQCFLPRRGAIVLDIFDLSGKKIFTQIKSGCPAGWNSIPIVLLTNTTYLYRIKNGSVSAAQKIIFIKR